MQILKVELDGGTVRGLGHPDVEIFSFAGLEEKHIVAVVQVG